MRVLIVAVAVALFALDGCFCNEPCGGDGNGRCSDGHGAADTICEFIRCPVPSAPPSNCISALGDACVASLDGFFLGELSSCFERDENPALCSGDGQLRDSCWPPLDGGVSEACVNALRAQVAAADAGL